MKQELFTAIKVFIYGNMFFACTFFWFHAPQIFGLK